MRNRMVTGALCATVLIGVAPIAAANAATGPMAFNPIDGSAYDEGSTTWSEPYVAPDGFTQTLVADETVLDIYAGEDDLTDMNVTNETGRQAGRYLYRTHEVGANGSLSVVDLQTGEAKVLEQQEHYNRLDGLTWTPWGTLLFAEETAGGHVYEAFLDPKDPTVVTHVEERTQLGILRHEGIGADADGSVYVIDELNGGSIYKFVPTVRGDLAAGQLYALKLTGLTDAEQLWNQATFSQKVGDVRVDRPRPGAGRDRRGCRVERRGRDRVRPSRGRAAHRAEALRGEHVRGPRDRDRSREAGGLGLRREGRERARRGPGR